LCYVIATDIENDWLVNFEISKKPSFLKPLSQMSRNLVGNIYGRFSINANFGSIRLQTWPPQAILVFDWSISKKSPTLKPLSQMNQNVVESIYGGPL
jgi:hypothetical protein